MIELPNEKFDDYEKKKRKKKIRLLKICRIARSIWKNKLKN